MAERQPVQCRFLLCIVVSCSAQAIALARSSDTSHLWSARWRRQVRPGSASRLCGLLRARWSVASSVRQQAFGSCYVVALSFVSSREAREMWIPCTTWRSELSSRVEVFQRCVADHCLDSCPQLGMNLADASILWAVYSESWRIYAAFFLLSESEQGAAGMDSLSYCVLFCEKGLLQLPR